MGRRIFLYGWRSGGGWFALGASLGYILAWIDTWNWSWGVAGLLLFAYGAFKIIKVVEVEDG